MSEIKIDLTLKKSNFLFLLCFKIAKIKFIPMRQQSRQRNSFLCPATKSGGVLCYTLRTFECPSVRPSAVDHSCPLYNFDTVQDNFTKLGTNVKHDQTTCRD